MEKIKNKLTTKFNICYDKTGDILDVTFGAPSPAIFSEVKNDIFLRYDEKTKEVVGFMILNFQKILKSNNRVTKIPIPKDLKFV